jgi:hypothetical protein
MVSPAAMPCWCTRRAERPRTATPRVTQASRVSVALRPPPWLLARVQQAQTRIASPSHAVTAANVPLQRMAYAWVCVGYFVL